MQSYGNHRKHYYRNWKLAATQCTKRDQEELPHVWGQGQQPRVPGWDSSRMAERSSPSPRSGAVAGRSYPEYEGRCSQEETPRIRGQGRWPGGALSVQAQEGLEELSHVEGQEGQWWGDTPHPAALCWSSREEISHAQGKRNPNKMVGVARRHQRAGTLKPYSQKTSQSNHTRTTALSNSMKPSHACGATQDRQVMVERSDNVVHWRREWQTTSVFMTWEPQEQYEKAK